MSSSSCLAPFFLLLVLALLAFSPAAMPSACAATVAHAESQRASPRSADLSPSPALPSALPRFAQLRTGTKAKAEAMTAARVPNAIANLATPMCPGGGCHSMADVKANAANKVLRAIALFGAAWRRNGHGALLASINGKTPAAALLPYATVALAKAAVNVVYHANELARFSGSTNRERKVGADAYLGRRLYIRSLANGNALLTWIDAVVSGGNVPLYTAKVDDGGNTNKLYIQGAGPTGLATAAYAMNAGMKVKMVNDRCSYTRPYAVDLHLGEGGHGDSQVRQTVTHGYRWLLTQLGIVEAKAAQLIKLENPGDAVWRMTISDVEWYMATVLWLMSQGQDTLQWNGCGGATDYAQKRAQSRDPEDNNVNDVVTNPAAHVAIPVPAGAVAWPAPADAARPVVFADGAGSVMAYHLRTNPNAKLAAYVRSGNAMQVLLDTDETMDADASQYGQERALLIEAAALHASLTQRADSVVFVMWVFKVTTANRCPGIDAVSAAVRANNGDNYAGFVHNWAFSKLFEAKLHCSIELGFRREVGEMFLQAMLSGRNRNSFSWPGRESGESQQQYEHRAKIVYVLLRDIAQSAGVQPPNINSVVEMKVWRSTWGMTTFRSKDVNDNPHRVPAVSFRSVKPKPAGQPNELVVDNAAPCGILLGDALRPALTAYAMGVNSAAVEAKQVVAALAAGSPANTCGSLSDYANADSVMMKEQARSANIRHTVGVTNANIAAGLGDAIGNWAFNGNTESISPHVRVRRSAGPVYKFETH